MNPKKQDEDPFLKAIQDWNELNPSPEDQLVIFDII